MSSRVSRCRPGREVSRVSLMHFVVRHPQPPDGLGQCLVRTACRAVADVPLAGRSRVREEAGPGRQQQPVAARGRRQPGRHAARKRHPEVEATRWAGRLDVGKLARELGRAGDRAPPAVVPVRPPRSGRPRPAARRRPAGRTPRSRGRSIMRAWMIGMIAAFGARIHPTRRPPQKDFDDEPIISARGLYVANTGGSSMPSRFISRNDSSTTGTTSWRRISYAHAPRSSSLMTAPVGLWKSGTKYAARCGAPSSAARERCGVPRPVVDRQGSEPAAGRRERLVGVRIAESLDHDPLPGVEERAGQQRDGAHRPSRHDDLVRIGRQAAFGVALREGSRGARAGRPAGSRSSPAGPGSFSAADSNARASPGGPTGAEYVSAIVSASSGVMIRLLALDADIGNADDAARSLPGAAAGRSRAARRTRDWSSCG